jgi:hypothetical protein
MTETPCGTTVTDATLKVSRIPGSGEVGIDT